MNRTIKAITASILVLIITFAAISITQDIARRAKADVTEQRLYTLSDGTKAILAKLNQPVTMKLYYAKKASLKAPDQIRFFNNYYNYVLALLEEYQAQSNGKVDLELIDPRPYTDEEANAMRAGLKRYPITEEENFFFGLVLQTQFGVEKTIPFFSPDRQSFIEYDISKLIDSAITRNKTRVGVISSLEVVGDDLTPYMRQMMQLQGQQPSEPWGIVQQLKEQYEITNLGTDLEKIENIDMLLVIHPKNLAEKTQFAIDQFVLNGGRAAVFVDPYCVAEQASQGRNALMQRQIDVDSNLPTLLKAWGLEMPANTVAGDRALAMENRQAKVPMIGLLKLDQGCFPDDSIITGSLNQVNLGYAGVLKQLEGDQYSSYQYTPLLQTTELGNSLTVNNPMELQMNPAGLFDRFFDGDKPVVMGYQVTGKFASAFPQGVQFEVEADAKQAEGEEQPEPETKTLTGLTQAENECMVAVYADVDMIADWLSYQQSFFGKMPVGDNSSLALNTIDVMSGSTELIQVRTKGSYKRPFTVVDRIEQQAKAETEEQVKMLDNEKQRIQAELNEILQGAGAKEQSQADIIGSSIIEKQRQLELKLRETERKIRDVRMQRRERIEELKQKAQAFNMLMAPAVILLVAIVLAIYRALRKRQYVSSMKEPANVKSAA